MEKKDFKILCTQYGANPKAVKEFICAINEMRGA